MLARGVSGTIQAIRIEDFNAWGIQSHIEINEEKLARWLELYQGVLREMKPQIKSIWREKGKQIVDNSRRLFGKFLDIAFE